MKTIQSNLENGLERLGLHPTHAVRLSDPHLLLGVGVLLIAAFNLGLHVDELSVWSDEMWSIFHSSRSWAQILGDPDLTWPPGYYLLLHGWMALTGTSNDFAAHALGLLMGLMTCAMLIRAGAELGLPEAGLIAGLGFGCLSSTRYFALEIRPYGLKLLLAASFIVAFLRWNRTPNLRRGILLLSIAVLMLYVHFVSLVLLGLAAAYVVTNGRPRVRSWLALCIMAGIAWLPLAGQFWSAFLTHVSAGLAGEAGDVFRSQFDELVRAYTGAETLWLVPVAALVLAGLGRSRPQVGWRPIVWLSLWGIGLPLLALLAREQTLFFNPRHLAFTLPASLLVFGLGIASLPWRAVTVAVVSLMLLAPWRPFDFRPAYSDAPPVRDLMRFFSQEFHAGDRLVIDPGLATIARSLEWEYYKGLYLPAADMRLEESGPLTDRRVWFLRRQGGEDKLLFDEVTIGREQMGSWGPWYLHASLHVAPPEDLGLPVGYDFRFLGADVRRQAVVHAGDRLPIVLWWTTDTPGPANRMYSLVLRRQADQETFLLLDSAWIGSSQDATDTLQPTQLLVDTLSAEIPYGMGPGGFVLLIEVHSAGDELSQPGAVELEVDQFDLATWAGE
jgi:hypothetical protein